MQSAKNGIRARKRSYDGVQEVHFSEYPGHWICTNPPLMDREKVLKWAKVNRERLIRLIKGASLYG